MCVGVYVLLPICLYAYTGISLRTYVHMCTYIHIYMYMYIYIHIHITYVYVYIYTCTFMCIHIYLQGIRDSRSSCWAEPHRPIRREELQLEVAQKDARAAEAEAKAEVGRSVNRTVCVYVYTHVNN